MSDTTPVPTGSSSEHGFAMISVILFGVVLLAVVLLATSQADQAVSGSAVHVSFEQEIHLAETGVDQSLARLQKDPTWGTVDTSTGTTTAELDAWAVAALATAPVVASDGGEYAVVKPKDRQVVYAAGWSPSRADARRHRMVKAEYLFSTYSPANAVLSNGNLQIGGNATVAGSLGNVHANGDVTVVGSALSVSGTLTATGAVSGGQAGWQGSQPPQEVPTIDPRAIYDRYSGGAEYVDDWYDLCQDGTVRKPSTAGPCTGEIRASSGGLRGWKFSSGKWVNDRDPYDGVYYVDRGTASIKGTATPWRGTILASASGSDGSLVGGDIEMTGKPLISAFLPDIALVAGRDLDIAGTGQSDGSYDGLLGAHEQLELTGNPTLDGALVSENAPHTTGSPVSVNYISGSMTITHNQGLEADLGGLIRTTLWLEL